MCYLLIFIFLIGSNFGCVLKNDERGWDDQVSTDMEMGYYLFVGEIIYEEHTIIKNK